MARGRRAGMASSSTSKLTSSKLLLICRLHLRNIRFMPSLEVELVVERAE